MNTRSCEIERYPEGSEEEVCPYRLISISEGILYFDPGRDKWVKPSDHFIETWCNVDFRTCPSYLAFEINMRAGKRKNFIL